MFFRQIGSLTTHRDLQSEDLCEMVRENVALYNQPVRCLGGNDLGAIFAKIQTDLGVAIR